MPECLDDIKGKGIDISKITEIVSKADLEEDAELEAQLEDILQQVLEDYNQGRDIDNMNFFEQPDPDIVAEIIQKLLMVLFPGYYRDRMYHTRNAYSKLSVTIEDVMYLLRKQIEIALNYDENFAGTRKTVRKREAKRISIEFFRKIPKIREYLNTDLQAIYDGDPAATNKEEIVLCYPGLLATAVYRLAHELVLLNVPVLPRMMSEWAHAQTGVDIHPAATIGKYFMIDHATGIVVGSTSIIGEHVKVYQGVTIGALSTKQGHKLHGTKRHPTIEDYVTLYSGASVLGGDTVIGEGSVIGGNAFITKSVPPHTRVNVKLHEMSFDSNEEK